MPLSTSDVPSAIGVPADSLSIERASLIKKYERVKLTSERDGGIGHPVKLLHKISEDPFIAECVTDVSFDCQDEFNWTADGQSLDISEIDNEIWDMIKELDGGIDFLQRSPYFSQHEDFLRQCHAAILSGRQFEAIILLLVSFPNLEKLRWSDSYDWNKQMVKSIIAFAATSGPTSGVFSKLLTVEGYHWDTEGQVATYDLLRWALIPSVRNLKGVMVGGDPSIHVSRWAAAVLNNIESIDIDLGAIRTRELDLMLLPMRRLKEFRYCHDSNAFTADTFRNGRYVQVLASRVGETLEILSLTSPHGRHRPVRAGFMALKKLRELEIDVGSLIVPADDDTDEDDDTDAEDDTTFGEESDEEGKDEALESGFYHEPQDEAAQDFVPRLVDILPSTIEKLILHIGRNEKETYLLLRGFASSKQSHLPKLTKFAYGGKVTLAQATVHELENAGIEVEQMGGYW